MFPNLILWLKIRYGVICWIVNRCKEIQNSLTSIRRSRQDEGDWQLPRSIFFFFFFFSAIPTTIELDFTFVDSRLSLLLVQFSNDFRDCDCQTYRLAKRSPASFLSNEKQNQLHREHAVFITFWASNRLLLGILTIPSRCLLLLGSTI